VHRADIAEDLVQEALLSALKSIDRFRGQSHVRTWLVAILKRKIVDHHRQLARASEVSSEIEESDSWVDSLFDDREQWKVSPGDWGPHSADALERSEFWQVFQECLEKLPHRLASAGHL